MGSIPKSRARLLTSSFVPPPGAMMALSLTDRFGIGLLLLLYVYGVMRENREISHKQAPNNREFKKHALKNDP